MRYPHSREQSLTILRETVRQMSQQSAALHPVSYAVWYEHLAGMNQELSSALSQRLTKGALDDASTLEIYENFVNRSESEPALARILASVMQEVLEAVQSVGVDLARFRETLESRDRELSSPLEQMAVRAIVAGLVGDTRRMHVVTGDLTASLSTNLRAVDDLKVQLEQARKDAQRDILSGLANRRGFENAVQSLEREGYPLADCSLLFIDIDHFKRINDTYGHALGDRVLQTVGSILQKATKGQDIAARLGGEEFAVLLPETRSQGAMTVAERIRSSVARCCIRLRDGRAMDTITVSIGVAEGKVPQQLDELLERADLAMYAAKTSGRNRIHGE